MTNTTPLPAPVDAERHERAAIELWNRFAPDHRTEWAEETHKGEYRDAARSILALSAMSAGTVAQEAVAVKLSGHELWEILFGVLQGDVPIQIDDEVCSRIASWINDVFIAPSSPEQAPHPDDLAVDRFAAVMKAKLAKKRDEGRSGWEDKDDCSQILLSHLLREHVEKGDPVDVGNLAMMLHQREERISSLLETLQGE